MKTIVSISSYPNPYCGISHYTENLLAGLKIGGVEPLHVTPYEYPLALGRIGYWTPEKLELRGDVADSIAHVQYEPGLSMPIQKIRDAFDIVIGTAHQLFTDRKNKLPFDYLIVPFKELADGNRIIYMPHPCRRLVFRIDKLKARKMLNLNEEKKIIVMPGRLEARKNFQEIIPVFEELKNYELYIIGGIPDTHFYLHYRYIRCLMKLPNVHIIAGFPIPEWILDLYCQASDYLLFNNCFTHYSVSGCAQACWEFNKIGISPHDVLLFSELTNENSIKYYNPQHLHDILVAGIDEDLETCLKIKLAEEFETKNYIAVAAEIKKLYERLS